MPETQLVHAPASDNRRSPRFSCSLNLAIEWGTALLDGVVKEISAEGMFVELDGPLWVGARFFAQLLIDGPVALDCVVRRVEPRRGMAVSFSALQPEGRSSVSSMIERLAAQ